MNKLLKLRGRLNKEEDKLMLLEFIDIGRKRRRGEKVSSLVWSFYLKYTPLSLILLISGYYYVSILSVHLMYRWFDKLCRISCQS